MSKSTQFPNPDFLKPITFWGQRCSETKFAQGKERRLCQQKLKKSSERFCFCSFAFDHQQLTQNREDFAGMYVHGPADFRKNWSWLHRLKKKHKLANKCKVWTAKRAQKRPVMHLLALYIFCYIQ